MEEVKGFILVAIKKEETEMKARKEMVRMGTKIGATLGGVAVIIHCYPSSC